MAAETVTFSDKWSTKIRANDGPWGTIGAWRDDIKAYTKQKEANHRIRLLEAQLDAERAAGQATILGDQTD